MIMVKVLWGVGSTLVILETAVCGMNGFAYKTQRFHRCFYHVVENSRKRSLMNNLFVKRFNAVTQ